MAERRYQAVDPANRLVAATLERQWEDALQNERGLKEECDRHCRQTLVQLSTDDEARITALASDIPALWHAPTTTNAERQAIVRCLIERVVVYVEPSSEDTVVTIHWIGGFESQHEFARPVRTYDQLCQGDRLMKRVVELREAGKTSKQTAEILNLEGFKPIDPHGTFNHVLQSVDVVHGETSCEIACRGVIRNTLGTESIEEIDIVAAQLDVLHVFAMAQGIEGEVKDVIGFVIRQMDFEDVESFVNGVNEADVLGEFVQQRNAAETDAGGARREVVAEPGIAPEDGLGAIGEFGFVESALDFPFVRGELAVAMALVAVAFGAMFVAASLDFVLASGAFVA